MATLAQRILDLAIAIGAQVKVRVRYDAVQTLTAPQQAQARANIGAVNLTDPNYYAELFALLGDCDPRTASDLVNNNNIVGPTPTQITTALARAVSFTPPRAMLVKTLWYFAAAAFGGYKFAIYDGVTLAKVWEGAVVVPNAFVWNSYVLAAGQQFTLVAGRRYWFCMTASAAGTSSAYKTPIAPVAGNWHNNTGPLFSASLGLPVYRQFAVSGGVFPASLPSAALDNAAYAAGTTGTIPIFFASPV